MEPKVSVIVPVYNVEKYLPQCLDSILSQTLKDIEVICIDDGSTDNSLNIAIEYAQKDSRVAVLTQKNEYAGVARNNGLKIAKGEYLSFLDSDDFFELNMLEEMYKKAKEDDSDIVVCGWNNYNNISGEVVKRFEIDDELIKLSPFNPRDVKHVIFEFSKPNAWTKLYKREFFIKNGLYFETCKCYNDMTCVYRSYVSAKKISVMKECFVFYRNNQNSNLTSQWNINFDCVIYAISTLCNALVRTGYYHVYKVFFIKKMASFFKNRFKKLTPEYKIECAKLAKKKLPEQLYKYIDKICNLTHFSRM